MSHFRFIEKNIDVSKIINEIRSEDWDVAGKLEGCAMKEFKYG